MKLTCELCGGALQMNCGGQGATCVSCGLTYPMDRLREMLGLKSTVTQAPPKRAAEEKPAHEVTDWKPVEEPAREAFVPKQFILQNDGNGKGELSGYVQQGGIGLGDKVYIDHDYSRGYTVYLLNDDTQTASVKAGMRVDLYLERCPGRVSQKAQVVTGAPDPLPNAYNFQGTPLEYFADLLSREFSQYEIRRNVPHAALRIPVNFMLYRDGQPALAIFVVNSNDNKVRYQAQKSGPILAQEGIASTYFYENYRNDTPYVIDRIRAALG